MVTILEYKNNEILLINCYDKIKYNENDGFKIKIFISLGISHLCRNHNVNDRGQIDNQVHILLIVQHR